jgi:hypothetical protein
MVSRGLIRGSCKVSSDVVSCPFRRDFTTARQTDPLSSSSTRVAKTRRAQGCSMIGTSKRPSTPHESAFILGSIPQEALSPPEVAPTGLECGP